MLEIEKEKAKFQNKTYRSHYNYKPTKRYLKFLRLERKVSISSQFSMLYMEKVMAILSAKYKESID
jgi:hypothetical protein